MSRRLGQHFLKNAGKIRKIADSLELKRGDFVIEIGPGHGEMTQELGARQQALSIRIIAIEKDPRLVEKLNEKFHPPAGGPKIEIIGNDVLKILTEVPKAYGLKPKAYKIVGNIPYYITGKLLRILSELEPKPEIIVLTVQKEVAERLTARPPKMNLLAASVQFWADPEIIDYISKSDFKPQPKVDSAIVKLKIKNYESGIMDNYYKLIKILFKQPRKTILNNLSAGLSLGKDKITGRLDALKISPSDRPQNLGIEEIMKLSRELEMKNVLSIRGSA
ncbi:ribosomal RNA small subunit methyltransferase A [Candidatus Jorgensenbacteria bacterium GWA1_49_17]|uniref:Ribosomal RNA small subunit methyltransferase A n=1 Tax=Candidatus Jorgensenbacteria bacterium GWA1_49_17 TaxID=1798467 RepID=A0A1F6BT64_9BACT|nr:MAG: Ribosomal RNA small subunit methyltransferase A [Parcubacteria group bacterium GW2011_GWC1_43_11]OGG40149.1 MAG: ribosomal RNA small subunit methyltransferase A [Candidatus Jorgensenbacteria bacterium GWA1_49_17]